MEERVVLVSEQDEVLGTMEKMKAHENGVLHRAFSVFLFNDQGEMLLQKRAEGKHYYVALSHAAKKLVRLIYHLEKTGQLYKTD